MNFYFVLINRLIHPTFVNKERLYLNHTVTYWRLGDEKTSMWIFKLIIIQGVSKKGAGRIPRAMLHPHLKVTYTVLLWPSYEMYVFDRLLGKASIKKKRFLSGIAQISYPPWPQFGQLGPFFSEVKIQDLKVSLKLNILYTLYNILYICHLKNSQKFNTLAFLKK